jgi:hypothetical protein
MDDRGERGTDHRLIGTGPVPGIVNARSLRPADARTMAKEAYLPGLSTGTVGELAAAPSERGASVILTRTSGAGGIARVQPGEVDSAMLDGGSAATVPRLALDAMARFLRG